MKTDELKKIFLTIIGCIGLVLGAIGAIVPVFPTVPFLLLSVSCFAKSSERLHRWFTGTGLYRNNLESYVRGEGMTRRTKIRIMLTVTLLMEIGFYRMDSVPAGRVILTAVWLFHIVYFMFRVKTRKAEDSKQMAAE
ncbi:MAG: YbaN family protein [Lachnospiraceae bacterium]